MKPDKPGYWWYKKNDVLNLRCIEITEKLLSCIETLSVALNVQKWIGQAHPPKINRGYVATIIDAIGEK